MQTDIEAEALLSGLKANPVFEGIADGALAHLARGAVLQTYSARESIFDEGQPSDHVYVLVAGAVRVFHDDGKGRQVTVKHLSPPSTFAEMEVLSNVELQESTEALVETSLIRLDAQRFCAFLEAEPTATWRLLGDVCRRFCVAAKNEHSVFFEVPRRLASLMLSYADMFGASTPAGTRIKMAVTQEDFANGLGVTLRSVARALAAWREEGWVDIHKGWYVIKNIDELEELAQGIRFNLNYSFAPDEGDVGPAE